MALGAAVVDRQSHAGAQVDDLAERREGFHTQLFSFAPHFSHGTLHIEPWRLYKIYNIQALVLLGT